MSCAASPSLPASGRPDSQAKSSAPRVQRSSSSSIDHNRCIAHAPTLSVQITKPTIRPVIPTWPFCTASRSLGLIELAESQGERFEWLKSGARVRVVKFSVNAGFVAQVQLLDQRVPAAAERRYWVNNCFLVMKDPQYQALWGTAKSAGCSW